jgi:hypothetical protein
MSLHSILGLLGNSRSQYRCAAHSSQWVRALHTLRAADPCRRLGRCISAGLNNGHSGGGASAPWRVQGLRSSVERRPVSGIGSSYSVGPWTILEIDFHCLALMLPAQLSFGFRGRSPTTSTPHVRENAPLRTLSPPFRAHQRQIEPHHFWVWLADTLFNFNIVSVLILRVGINTPIAELFKRRVDLETRACRGLGRWQIEAFPPMRSRAR